MRTVTAWFAFGAAVLMLTGPAAGSPCDLSSSDRRWIDAAIATWSRAAAALERAVDEMPWTLLYDEHCVVEISPRGGGSRTGATKGGGGGAGASDAGAGGEASLAITFNGKPVPARSARYRRRFALPSGQKLGSDAVAFTALARDGGPFFVMALPSVWSQDPRSMPGEDIAAFASGVLAHEMTHTLHISSIAAAVEAVERRYPMPASIDDDYLQTVFSADAEYVADYDRELALYAGALAAADDGEARGLARQALDASEERRARHFQGEHAFFLEVEPLFLNMEGVASWVAYTVVGGGVDPLAFSGRFWSQQEGLLLFLLIDRFDPAWKIRVFDAAVPDPFSMLGEAVRDGGMGSG